MTDIKSSNNKKEKFRKIFSILSAMIWQGLLFTFITVCNRKDFQLNGATAYNLEQNIERLNYLNNYDLNVFVNIPLDAEGETYSNMFRNNHPKLIISEHNEIGNVRSIYGKFTEHTLIIAGFTNMSKNWTLKIVSKVLWRIHYKDILLLCNDIGEEHASLLNFFELCYSNGFTSVLLWHHQKLLSYHPYPSIEIISISDLIAFQDKSHLNNFQKKTFRLPFVEFPPRCFSYTNRKGERILTGYHYKMCEVYLSQHNATVEHRFIDMWNINYTPAVVVNLIEKNNLAIITIPLQTKTYFQSSKVIKPYKIVLIVPSAKEIDGGLYLAYAFTSWLWLLIIFIGILIFGLMLLLHYKETQTLQFAASYLEAWNILIYLSISIYDRRTFLYFLLVLLCNFTGFFIVNYYSANLSSMYTAKIYEPEMKKLEQVQRNNLLIQQYTSDLYSFDAEPIPSVVKKRIFSGNNSALHRNRKKLMVNKFMYTARSDLADYILFQQLYLRKPFARKLEDPLKLGHTMVNFPPRSPLINGFNKYLQYIIENGLFQKFVEDSKWAGIISGDLRFFMDVNSNVPLTLEYFEYAFALWALGLTIAFLCFAVEFGFEKLKKKGK